MSRSRRSRRWAAPVLLAAVAPIALPALATAAPVSWPKPERYSLALRYSADSHALSGSERISLVNSGPRAVRSVWLRVWPNAFGSCAEPRAHISAGAGARLGGQAVGCTALRVRLAHKLEPGAKRSFSLRLRITAPGTPNVFGRDHGIDYFGNAIPALAVADSTGTHLNPYSPVGDPFYSLDAHWSVTLDMPFGLSAPATGTVTRRRRIGRGLKRLYIDAPHARDFALTIGPMKATSATADGIRINRYRLPSSSAGAARATVAVAADAISSYSDWYGSPGQSEVDLVPAPSSLGDFGSGMEYPGLVLTSDDPQLVAHELAHQWWYSLVGDDEWSSPWLDESFAEYSSRQLPQSVIGAQHLSCDDANPVGAFGAAPLTAGMDYWDGAGGTAYYREVYLGGTCALRALADDIGPDAMRAFLRSYVDAHRDGVVTTADFVAALRAAAPPGYDVDAFLRRARIG